MLRGEWRENGSFVGDKYPIQSAGRMAKNGCDSFDLGPKYRGGSVWRGPWDHEVLFVISDILLDQYILNNTGQNKLFNWDLK